jgi:riboflavin-specific deaminase-like protein
MKRPAIQRRKPRPQRPFVFMNMAMTADGKIATANRAASSPGSARDHAHLYELRATADAVMCGARTADLNKITLGNGGAKFRRQRLRRGLGEHSLRILVTGSGTLDPQAEVFRHRFSPIIVITTARVPKARLARLRSAADEVRIGGRHEINWPATLRWLRQKWRIKRLLCEGGGTLNDALFRAGIVDELHLTLCPKVFGGRNAPTLSDGRGVARLAHAAQFELRSARRAGDEIFLTFRHNTRRPPAPRGRPVATTDAPPSAPGARARRQAG